MAPTKNPRTRPPGPRGVRGVRRAGRWLVAMVVGVLWWPLVEAGEYCEPDLVGKTMEASPVAYSERGDRCEGFYAQPVSGVNLELRSFTETFLPFVPTELDSLQIEWVLPPGLDSERVHLRALSVRSELYYRMDTAVPAGQGHFLWGGELLASQGIGPKDIGVLGWVEGATPGDPDEPLHLPLRIGPGSSALGPNARYRLTFQPAITLHEVLADLYRLDEKGNRVAVFEGRDLDIGYYPSNRPVTFPFEKPSGSGYFLLLIRGSSDSGRSAFGTLSFYQMGS